MVVGDAIPPNRLVARARRTVPVTPGEPLITLIADLRSHIPRRVGVLGRGDEAAPVARELHERGLPVVLHTDDDVTIARRPHAARHRPRRADGRRRRPRRAHRQHADGAPRSHGARPRLPPARQARALQPGVLVEGPPGADHDRERRARRAAPARRHDRRADQRQHRRRPRHRGGPPRLLVHLRVPRQGGARQDRPAARLRRRGHRVPDVGRPEPPRLVLLGVRSAGPRGPRARGSPTSTTTPTTRGPSTRPPARRSGSRRAGASRTSSAASARAAPSPASGATSRSRTRRSASSAPTPRAPCTPAAPVARTSSRASARTSGRRPTTRRSSTRSSPSATPTSFATARRVTREEGLLIGGSGGTAIAAALQVADGPPARRRRRRAHPRLRPGLPVQALRRRLDGRPRLPPRGRPDGRRPAARAATPACRRSCTPIPTRPCARPSRSCASSR